MSINQFIIAIKNYYNYIFYRAYKIAMLPDFNWLPVYRAIILMSILELFLIITLLGFLRLFFNIPLIPVNYDLPFLIILGFILYEIKNYSFYKDDKWKSIVKKYDGLSKNKQLKGIISFVILIILILGSFIVMLYVTGKKSGVIE